MHLKVLLGGILILWSYILHAQQGNLYLHNYYSPVSNTDYQNLSAVQDRQGILYFANTKGIITYDGVNWDITPTFSTPHALAYHNVPFGKVYVGCNNNFGYLETDIFGRPRYVPISAANKPFGAITKIILNETHAFFYSSKVLYRVSLQTQKVEKVFLARKGANFTGILLNKERVFVNVSNEGLHQIKNDELLFVPETSNFGELKINTCLKYDDVHTLVGTSNNHLYLFNGTGFSPYEIAAQDYLEENMLVSGMNISHDKFALATLSGGAIIIDKRDKKTRQTINYQTGLPDDEVLAMCADLNGGLWLCTEYSISRVDLNLPIKNFGEYPGLEGQITGVLKLDTNLYVGTSEGLFYLEKINRFDELLTIVREKEKFIETQTTVEKTIRITKLKEKNSVGKFFQSVFGSKDKQKKAERARKKAERKEKREEKKRKKKNEITEVENPPKTEKEEDDVAENQLLEDDEAMDLSSSISSVQTQPTFKTSTTYIAGLQRNYALMSIPYVYKKIEGLNTKSQQLVRFRNRILVATNLGLYEIVDKKARLIVGDVNVHFIYPSEQDSTNFFLGTDQGLYLVKFKGEDWNVEVSLKENNLEIFSISGKGNELWLGGRNLVIRVNLNEFNKPIRSQKYAFANNYAEPIIARFLAGQPTFFASSGIFSYRATEDVLYLNNRLTTYFNPRSKIIFKQNGFTWVRPTNRWENIQDLERSDNLHNNFLSLFKEVDDIYVDEEKNLWIATNNFLYKVHAESSTQTNSQFHLLLRSIKNIQGKLLSLDNLWLNYQNNAIKIELAATFYLNENTTEYQYKIEGLQDNWSTWSNQSTINIPYLPTGKYTLKARARNVFGQTSEELKYTFQVSPAFWQTWWFYVLIIGGLLGIMYLFSKLRTQTLERANQKLALNVQRKTAEIEQQKQALEVAYEEIEKKNRDITASIRYAQRIQEAILPYPETIEALLTDSFVLYSPRDVVSGDFYWIEEKTDCILIVVADCTGHGVPGAFMSMIGNTLLDQIVHELQITDPATILNYLDKGIVKALKQDDPKSTRFDGMDISICKIDKMHPRLTYAGANNPLFIVRNGICEEISANRLGIGGLQRFEKIFTNQRIHLESDTYVYLSSDGYLDQIGEKEKRKFMRKNFRALVESIAHLSSAAQKEYLMQAHNDWKGKNRQIDDILILGFRVKIEA